MPGLPTRTYSEQSGRRGAFNAEDRRAAFIGLATAGDLVAGDLVKNSTTVRSLYTNGQLVRELEAFFDAGADEAVTYRIAETTAGDVGDPVLNGTGEATAATGGTPTYAAEYKLRFVTAGASETAQFVISENGGPEGKVITTPASASAYTLPNGATITWTDAGTPADSFDVDDVWYVKVLAGAPTNANIMAAVRTALVDTSLRQLVVSPTADASLAASLASEMEDQFEAGTPRVVLINPVTFDEYFEDNFDVAAYAADGVSSATGTATTTVVGNPWGDGNYRRVILKVTTAGEIGSGATVAISYDEGASYGDDITVVDDSPIFLEGLNCTIAFANVDADDLKIDETYILGKSPSEWKAALETTWDSFRDEWVHVPAGSLWLSNVDGSQYIGRPAGLTMGVYCKTPLGRSPSCVKYGLVSSALGFVGPFNEMENQYYTVLDELVMQLHPVFRYERGYGYTLGWGPSRDVDGSVHDIIESVFVLAYITATLERANVVVTGLDLSGDNKMAIIAEYDRVGKYFARFGAIRPKTWQTLEPIYDADTRTTTTGATYGDNYITKDVETILGVQL